MEADIDRGVFLNPRAADTPFWEVADSWLNARADRSRATLDRDRSYLASYILPTFANRGVGYITTAQILGWVANLKQAPATRAKALQILRSILDFARLDQKIRANPADDVKAPEISPVRLTRALSDGELAAMLDAAEKVDQRTAVMVYLMGRCGLRIGEVIGLRRSDVNLSLRTLSVRRSMSRREGIRPLKGRKTEAEGRVIPIPEDVVQRLRIHFKEYPPLGTDSPVVSAPRGAPIDYSRWRARVRVRITQEAGIKVTMHDLRRTTATRLFREDRWTPAEVQVYLGHRDPRMTLGVYTVVNPGDLPRPSALSAV